MSTKEKNIHNIDFLGKMNNWESWSEKFYHKVNRRAVRVGNRSTIGLDKTLMQSEFERTFEGEVISRKRLLSLVGLMNWL